MTGKSLQLPGKNSPYEQTKEFMIFNFINDISSQENNKEPLYILKTFQ